MNQAALISNLVAFHTAGDADAVKRTLDSFVQIHTKVVNQSNESMH